jgi:hypothetical protein
MRNFTGDMRPFGTRVNGHGIIAKQKETGKNFQNHLL